MPKRKPTTADHYRHILERLVLPSFGNRKVDQVTTADIARLHARLKDRPYLANRVVPVMGSLYSFAARRRLLPVGLNPARGIDKYPEKGRERYLTAAELTRLGDAIREAETIGIVWAVDTTKATAKHAPKEKNRRTAIGQHAAAAIRLLILTGARLREILHLQWDHVDVERGLNLNRPWRAIVNGQGSRACAFTTSGTRTRASAQARALGFRSSATGFSLSVPASCPAIT